MKINFPNQFSNSPEINFNYVIFTAHKFNFYGYFYFVRSYNFCHD